MVQLQFREFVDCPFSCHPFHSDVRCFLGIRIEELRHQVEKIDLKTECPGVIVIHAGTNNIRCGISATKIMGDTMDLVDYKKTSS